MEAQGQGLDRRAEAHRRAGDFEAAERAWRAALAVEPADAARWYNLGLLAQTRPNESAERYRRALALAPDLAPAHNNLGLALKALGDEPGARAAFGGAVARMPEFFTALEHARAAPAADALVSRHVRRGDPRLERYGHAYALGPARWDFIRLGWWSRIFEYRWIVDALVTHFADRLAGRTIVDLGCGYEHPGAHILADLGAGHVLATDLADRIELYDRCPAPNLAYRRHDMTQPLGRRFDAVVCISVLEHLPLADQAAALGHLADAVSPGGALLMTFDMPGFEHDTPLDLYRATLRRRGLAFTEAEVPADERLTSRNGPVAIPGFPEVGRAELEVYRLFAVRPA
jgi:SAM-dependent methyltransferase